MMQFIKTNRNILSVALGIFVTSMASLMFFLNTQAPIDGQAGHEVKADVLEAGTEHIETEKENAVREQLGNNEDSILILGLDGMINFSSSDFMNISGFTPEEMKEQLFFSYVHPDDLPMVFDGLSKVMETNQPTMIGPYRVLTKEGDYTFNMATLSPYDENDQKNIAVTAKEISQDMLDKDKTSETHSNTSSHTSIIKKKTLHKSPQITEKTENEDNHQNLDAEEQSDQDENDESHIQTEDTEESTNVSGHQSFVTKTVTTESAEIDTKETSDPENPSNQSETTKVKTKVTVTKVKDGGDESEIETSNPEKSTTTQKKNIDEPRLRDYREKEKIEPNPEGTPEWIISNEMAYKDPLSSEH